MKQEGLKFFSDIYLTNTALVLFFLVFIGVGFWVFRSGSKEHYKHMSQLPLKKDEL